MTVQSTLARVPYTISGAGPYTIPYYFLAVTDLIVIRTPVGGASPVTLVLTTDYTVTGAGVESGGTLTLVAPVNGDTLTIINEPAATQLVSYPETGKFPAKSHETALDRLTMVVKRVYDLASRGLRLNDGDTATSFVFPISSPGKLIGWGTDGKLTNTSPVGVGPGSITATELADNSVTVAKIADTELRSLAGLTAQQTTDLLALTGFIGSLLNDTNQSAAAVTLGTPLNSVANKTAAYSLVATDRGVILDCSGTFTVTAVAALGAGFNFAIRNTGTGVISVEGNKSLSETYDGVPTLSIGPGYSVSFVCIGAGGYKSFGQSLASISNFQAHRSVTQAIAATTFTKVIFDVESHDDLNEYNVTTGEFTAAAAGTYIFTAGILGSSATNTNRIIDIYKNGVTAMRLCQLNSAVAGDQAEAGISGTTAPMKLVAGDVITAYYYSTVAENVQPTAVYSRFGGYRIK